MEGSWILGVNQPSWHKLSMPNFPLKHSILRILKLRLSLKPLLFQIKGNVANFKETRDPRQLSHLDLIYGRGVAARQGSAQTDRRSGLRTGSGTSGPGPVR